jgi:hypothetical protein
MNELYSVTLNNCLKQFFQACDRGGKGYITSADIQVRKEGEVFKGTVSRDSE